jgi:hypothetical protein
MLCRFVHSVKTLAPQVMLNAPNFATSRPEHFLKALAPMAEHNGNSILCNVEHPYIAYEETTLQRGKDTLARFEQFPKAHEDKCKHLVKLASSRL